MMEAWDTKFLRAKGYPEHIVRTIISEIERVSTQGVAEEDILASLCIPMVGKSFGRMVINTLGGIGYLTELSSFDKLKSVPRINSTAIENARKFMEKNAGDFMLFYQMFLHPGTTPKEHTEDWPKFCFTGALPKSRKDIGAELLAKGATITENIREADFLVASNKLTQSSKMKYATKNNIPVISYEQIDKMIASFGK
jgi:NAD-dependent DNA ligase